MIPFNKPYYSGNEMTFISRAMESRQLTGDLEIVRMCESLLEKKYGFRKVFLTNSCTMALEMSAVLADIGPGDEVIMPSYTYISTANAFALRGANIVFADSKNDHPNMDEDQLEKLITSKTKAICVMHYAGVACNMDAVKQIAKKHNLLIIEDAAQCINSYYKTTALGAIAGISCFSFHETKNIHCGEGGFLAVNDPALIERAEVIRQKGTNRSAFIKGEVNKYEWVDLGYSSIPSAIAAAFLYPQLENIEIVQRKRIELWNEYYRQLSTLKNATLYLPVIPEYASNNAHIFYLVCSNEKERDELIAYLKKQNIQAVFHYQSLHNSPYYLGKHKGGALPNAERYSASLLRLPLFYELSITELNTICDHIIAFYSTR
ncbi:MAG: hypothetical protein JWP12_217 [Bacteroidetes bacterium]|nr:hypothetical protein [Bacteroidota bacterium]